MKNIHKYSVYIYIIIPVLLAIWPVLVLAIYLPGAKEKLTNDISTYADATNTMLDILILSPERIDSEDPNKETIEFSYDTVVNEVASVCLIHPSNCKWNTGPIGTNKNNKTQSATVRLSNVNIISIAKFLSTIQSQWPKLVCNSIQLDKKPNRPDEWDALMDFKYFYSASD